MSRTALGAALLAAAATHCVAPAAFAQPPVAPAAAPVAGAASAATRPDPTDPNAVVPSQSYRSALAGYRSNADQPVGPWRELNDQVGRIGGWRTYAREASQPDPSPARPGDGRQ